MENQPKPIVLDLAATPQVDFEAVRRRVFLAAGVWTAATAVPTAVVLVWQLMNPRPGEGFSDVIERDRLFWLTGLLAALLAPLLLRHALPLDRRPRAVEALPLDSEHAPLPPNPSHTLGWGDVRVPPWIFWGACMLLLVSLWRVGVAVGTTINAVAASLLLYYTRGLLMPAMLVLFVLRVTARPLERVPQAWVAGFAAAAMLLPAAEFAVSWAIGWWGWWMVPETVLEWTATGLGVVLNLLLPLVVGGALAVCAVGAARGRGSTDLMITAARVGIAVVVAAEVAFLLPAREQWSDPMLLFRVAASLCVEAAALLPAALWPKATDTARPAAPAPAAD